MCSKILFLLMFVVAVAYSRRQTITVKGRVTCDAHVVKRVRIQLREADTFDPDDTLATVHTDDHGFFEVSGEENEVTSIEPYLRIFHNCVNGIIDENCEITDDYIVPKEFIDSIYDMGHVSLNIAQEEHTKKCSK